MVSTLYHQTSFLNSPEEWTKSRSLWRDNQLVHTGDYFISYNNKSVYPFDKSFTLSDYLLIISYSYAGTNGNSFRFIDFFFVHNFSFHLDRPIFSYFYVYLEKIFRVRHQRRFLSGESNYFRTRLYFPSTICLRIMTKLYAI